MRTSLSFSRVSKRFGTTTVFQDDSLELLPGLTFLVGRNGAGKSTLVRLATGIERPAGGEIRILADPTHSITNETKRRFGLQLQNDAFLKGVRVREYVDLYKRMFLRNGESPLVDLDEVAHILEIDAISHSYAYALSGGQKKRVSLFLALIGKKELMILDEPTAGIDVDVKEKILRVIRLLQKHEIDLLISSHDLSEFFEVADNVLVVDRGVRFNNSKAEFLAAYGYTHKVVVTQPVADVAMTGIELQDGTSYYARSAEELHTAFPGQPVLMTTAKDLYQLATRAADREAE